MPKTHLSEMQGQVRSCAEAKDPAWQNLAAAVAKISHDLRNMLSVAQMTADRLEGSADPVVDAGWPQAH